LVGEDMNSGAAGDIKQATAMARHMVTEWGMSDRVGFVYVGEEPLSQRAMPDFGLGKGMAPKTAELIDQETKRIIDEAYADARRILTENRDKLEAVAQALLRYETLDGEEVRKLIAGESIDRPTVADLINAEQERRQSAPPVARPVRPPTDEEEAGPLPSPA
jgi:cell division protease FtsH